MNWLTNAISPLPSSHQTCAKFLVNCLQYSLRNEKWNTGLGCFVACERQWNTCLGLSWFGRKWQDIGWNWQKSWHCFAAFFSHFLAIFCQTKTAQGKCFIWRSQTTRQPRPMFHTAFFKVYKICFQICMFVKWFCRRPQSPLFWLEIFSTTGLIQEKTSTSIKRPVKTYPGVTDAYWKL